MPDEIGNSIMVCFLDKENTLVSAFQQHVFKAAEIKAPAKLQNHYVAQCILEQNLSIIMIH